MTAVNRTYWLTEPCRIRRDDNSVRIERADNSPVHIPITDIRDFVAFDHVDINTSAVSLLGRHGVTVHLLDHYDNYAGAIVPTEEMSSAPIIRRQVALTTDAEQRLAVAETIVAATAANIRWSLDTDLLDAPAQRLQEQLKGCLNIEQLMGLEGNFPPYFLGRARHDAADLVASRRTHPTSTHQRRKRLHQLRQQHYLRTGAYRAAMHASTPSHRLSPRRYRPATQYSDSGPGRTL